MVNWRVISFLTISLIHYQAFCKNASGTLCYNKEELSELINVTNKSTPQESLKDEENIEDMEIIYLKTLNVQADELNFELPSHFDETTVRKKDRQTLLRLRKKSDFDLITSMRADDAFWTGENDAGRNPDVPQVGSIDISPLINALLKSFSGKKKKELFNTR
ncbi:hypothetical protein MLD52_19140 [Puniceicoccaceae bacterium K14]|nr:hypothetical protein [Puniceicoccaceae bacterium K14]